MSQNDTAPRVPYDGKKDTLNAVMRVPACELVDLISLLEHAEPRTVGEIIARANALTRLRTSQGYA